MDLSRGTARYEIVKQLGSGGMGVVYEAIDRERDGRRVALKVLQRHDPEGLVRLKREFRSLADVRHRNLVSLYELGVEQDTWFFTLELVDGIEFLEWSRPGTKALSEAPTGQLEVTVRSGGPTPGLDLERLKQAFAQLVDGVEFLHQQGRLHRDLKPSNVMVSRDGRVVILDFGLVLELGGLQSLSEARGNSIVGTAAYMAPEQAGSGVVGPAADWYALGVMLFQALTGRLPFDGVAVQVLLEKQRRPAPSVRELSPNVPEEWDAICAQLLKREPAERPGANELRTLFGGAKKPIAPAAPRDTGFVGRQRERVFLKQALNQTRRGAPLSLELVGASGIGKSALVREFVNGLEGAVVLLGRCYERELVPFKALDSLVDALARHLSDLPAEKVDAVLPRDAAALTRMFPVLGRVAAFRSAPSREAKDPAELRRRGVQALRELFARMADRAPLVLVIDDAQWGDDDSAAVLDELLRPPDAPAVLLLVVARGEDHPLSRLRMTPRRLTLAPLSVAECEEIARRASPDAARAAIVAREAQGNPFLAQELASAPGDASLENVVATRLEALSAPARRLLELIALSASPIPEKAAAAAAELPAGDVDTLAVLKAARLVRGLHDDRLEAWHDRIRETVVKGISADRARGHHARLADALRETADIDRVAWHLNAAGLLDQAAAAMIEAARRAAAQLAFERAGLLLERALELLPIDDRRRRALRTEVAEIWANAGRGAVSARAYSLALEEPGDLVVADLEMKRRAAEQLLRTGHIDEGLNAVNQVLAAMGMSLAKTPLRALWALAFRRLHIWLRGRSFSETPEQKVAPEVLQRIDACWSVSMGLSMVDTIRGASFQARQLLLALDAGEPVRVTRALAAEAAFVATGGVADERRAAKLMRESRALAERLGDPALVGLVDFCDGLTHFLVGRWREAAQFTAQAERKFADVGSPLSWESANSRLFTVWSLFYLGDLAQLSVRIPALTREAEARGDRYAATSLQCGLANVSLLAADDPAGARRAVRQAMAGWSTRSFHFQHYWAALSETLIDLYTGEKDQTVARMHQCLQSLSDSQLLRIQNVRVEAWSLMARALLAQGRKNEALDVAELLQKERVGWADALALLIAGLAGDASALKLSAESFDRLEMRFFSAAVRWRLGDPQGAGWFRAQGVKNPERFVQLVCPV